MMVCLMVAQSKSSFLPRGLRNCNPCNLRRSSDEWRGLRKVQTDKDFFQFDTLALGFRAFFLVCRTYYARHGITRLHAFVERYAPASENNVNAYYHKLYVCFPWLSDNPLPPLDAANARFWCDFALAVARIENGLSPAAADRLLEDVKAGWFLYAANCGISVRHFDLNV